MRHTLVSIFFCASLAAAQLKTLSLPPDSKQWVFQGNTEQTEYKGRKCFKLEGGAAIVDDFEMRDGVIDFDAITPASAKRAFFGAQFRLAEQGERGEWVYLRPHKTGLPDAIQYTPIFHHGPDWQIYNGPGFTANVDLPRDEWLHVRLAVTGAQAKLYVQDMQKPALEMDDLKSDVQSGLVVIYNLTGKTYFSNVEIHETAPVPFVHHLPAMPPNTLTKWSLSQTFEALKRNVERPLEAAEEKAMKWEDVQAEPPGFVVVNRYRDPPNMRVTFQDDFSKRLDPQPGTQLVYARTTITSDRDQVKKLWIGYSDEVSVFVNGKILYRGRSAQSFRDPGFLGIVNPENDAVYIPLKKGDNELVLALSDMGGGWGFICRLTDF